MLVLSFAETIGGATQGALITSTSTAFYAVTEYSTTTSSMIQTERRGQWFSIDGNILVSSNEVQFNIRIRNLSSVRLSKVGVAIILELADGTYSKPLWVDVGNLEPEESTNFAKSIRADVSFNIVQNINQARFHAIRATMGELTMTSTRTITDYAVYVRQLRETSSTTQETKKLYVDTYAFLAVASVSLILLIIAVVSTSTKWKTAGRNRNRQTTIALVNLMKSEPFSDPHPQQ